MSTRTDDIGVGSRGWMATDRRVYPRNPKTGNYGGGPLVRGAWREVFVVGETTRSWICSSDPRADPAATPWNVFKIGKRDNGRVIFDGAHAELVIWASEHGCKLREYLQSASPEVLARVAEIAGYPVPVGSPNPDGEPWLIEGERNGHLINRSGVPVEKDGRPSESACSQGVPRRGRVARGTEAPLTPLGRAVAAALWARQVARAAGPRTIAELAVEADVSREHLSRVLRGRHRPGAALLERLLAAIPEADWRALDQVDVEQKTPVDEGARAPETRAG